MAGGASPVLDESPLEHGTRDELLGPGGRGEAAILEAFAHLFDDDVGAAPLSMSEQTPAPVGGTPTATPRPQQAPVPSPPAATPSPAPTAPTASPEGAPARKPGRGDTAAQNAEATDVRAAATDKGAREKLDIDWIASGVNPEVVNSIDSSYSATRHERSRDRSVSAAMKRFDRERAGELEAIRDSVATAKGLKRDPRTKKFSRRDLVTIDSDEALAERKTVDQEARAAAVAQAERDYDASVPNKKPQQSVTNFDEAKVPLGAGQQLARTNFMAWATYLMGDPAKVKRHFQGIRPTAGDQQMLLADGAADRFEAARAQFEKENPGYTLPTSGVAASMRDLHQQRQGLGMLGHALGLAVDFSAYESPNLKGDKGEQPGLNAYMLKRFGGGRAQMQINPADVEALGRETAAKTSTDKGRRTSAAALQQYGEIAQTSANFQRAMSPAQMASLRAGRDAYFGSRGDEARLASLRKQEGAERDPAKRAAVAQEISRVDGSLRLANARVASGLDQFSGWTTTLDAEVKTARGESLAKQVTADRYRDEAKAMGKMSKDQVDKYALAHGFAGRDTFTKSKRFATYEAHMKSQIEERERSARARVQYLREENAVKAGLVEKLRDPRRVFGTGVQTSATTWDTKREVSDVAVMQLLEDGFVKNDAMPKRQVDAKSGLPIDPKTGKPARSKEAVFNAQAVEMLARHGFAPGSNFGDTMHFDDMQGYSEAVPGGRNGENMNRLRFSPEGELITPPRPGVRRSSRAAP